MTIKELNQAKVPIVRIDKSLDKYKDTSLFQAKVEQANEVLKKIGLPEPKAPRKRRHKSPA